MVAIIVSEVAERNMEAVVSPAEVAEGKMKAVVSSAKVVEGEDGGSEESC